MGQQCRSLILNPHDPQSFTASLLWGNTCCGFQHISAKYLPPSVCRLEMYSTFVPYISGTFLRVGMLMHKNNYPMLKRQGERKSWAGRQGEHAGSWPKSGLLTMRDFIHLMAVIPVILHGWKPHLFIRRSGLLRALRVSHECCLVYFKLTYYVVTHGHILTGVLKWPMLFV